MYLIPRPSLKPIHVQSNGKSNKRIFINTIIKIQLEADQFKPTQFVCYLGINSDKYSYSHEKFSMQSLQSDISDLCLIKILTNF